MEATLMHKFGKAILISAFALVFSIPAANSVSAQGPEGGRSPIPIAVGDKVNYAGYVSETPISTEIRIVGAVNEAIRKSYSRGDRVYINRGQSQIQVGDLYKIVRPRGAFYHPFKNVKLQFPSFSRRGDLLGFYVDELGVARVLAVQDKTATLEVGESFADILIGDVLLPYQKRDMPEQRAYTQIDPLAPSSGKTSGQIIFSRSQREQLASTDVVIIDLGQKAGIKVGDYFTIYREQESEHINRFRDDEVALKRIEVGSERFRGGTFSETHPAIQQDKIDRAYPNKVLPRTIVGELVVTRVEGTTATAIITKTQRGEALLGDKIELQ
jgi:hypothetical protein